MLWNQCSGRLSKQRKKEKKNHFVLIDKVDNNHEELELGKIYKWTWASGYGNHFRHRVERGWL